MTAVEKAIDLFYASVEDGNIPEFIPVMSTEELQKLDCKRVKFAPEGARYIGGYFEVYHDVTVYEKDGEYYSVYDYIGD